MTHVVHAQFLHICIDLCNVMHNIIKNYNLYRHCLSQGGTGTPKWAVKLSLYNLIKKITPLITTEIYRNREFKIAMHVNIIAITPFDHATDLPA